MPLAVLLILCCHSPIRAASAVRSIERSLDLDPTPEDPNWYSQGVLVVAEIALLTGEAAGAAALFGRAMDGGEASVQRPQPFDEVADELWGRIRDVLGDEEAQRRRAEGAALDDEESMALVRRVLGAA